RRGAGPDAEAGRHRGDGQPGGPQGAGGRAADQGGRCGAALPAGVQPRPQPDREDVQQAEGLLVKGRRAHGGPAVRGDGGRVAFGDTSGYRRVVPILWLLYTQAETALAADRQDQLRVLGGLFHVEYALNIDGVDLSGTGICDLSPLE